MSLTKRLHLAVKNDDRKKVKQYITAGDDVNDVDGEDLETPLILAVTNYHRIMVQELLRAGADPEKKNKNGTTPLFFAAQEGRIEIARALLKGRADINGPSGEARTTPLMRASGNGHSDFVKFLLDEGGDVSRTGRQNATALALAASAGHSNVVNILIGAGADIHSRDERGGSPLINAAREGKLSAVVTLLERGADVNFAEYDGSTALHRTVIFGHDDVADVLIKAGAEVNTHHTEDYTPLLSTAQAGHTKCGHLLIKAGAKVNARGKDGTTPLYHVATRGFIEFLELVLQAGGVASIDVPDHKQRVPLVVAACAGHVKAVKFLLEAGSNPNVLDEAGWAPLHFAAYHGAIAAILVALVKGGADPTLRLQGRTPADMARIGGHVVTAQMLDRLATTHMERKANEERKTASDDTKGPASAKMSKQPDISAQMKSCSLKGSEKVKESTEERKKEHNRKTGAPEPCLNCEAMTRRQCSNCGGSYFCSHSCELSARHLCCG